jgi:hypothetical protein
MNITSHTPGPWVHTKNDPRLCIKGMEKLHCVSRRREEFADIVLETIAENISEHDAPLIAAAPDLLHALNLLLDKLNAHGIKNKHLFDAIENAESAISKAKGYK